ncbi:Actin-interacting protein 1 [Trichinella papuae]|uniref:Actin-interacting protein 1 n=1 Tax=Trichinella papuae TaxID=268474 RepID=A0A0V1MD55_9BILA|nr:Actin-interacting protein 1 [Trichinella papuae]KRZ69722.1 Actin-interacting protein 1 [Trichinella papuae]
MNYHLENVFAALPRTTRGMPMVLNGDPKGKKFLYCNGNSVVIRDLENPKISDVYTEHSTLTTVAKYSPNGSYIASGAIQKEKISFFQTDKSGKIRIWDTTQKEHILKKEYQPLPGAVRDIGWSEDGQRLAVVGDGREKFGHVFLFETGTSNGTLCGQTKALNSVDFRPVKPLRIVCASEDNSTAIFEGPPFKFKTLNYNHSRFAQCVRYAPDGELFASCGADGKVFVYEGLEGSVVKEFVDPACKDKAHDGSAYALSWKSDGRQLLTASADKTCKIWDVETGSVVSTFKFGNSIEDQQLACLWQGSYLLSVSLGGCINYLDVNNPNKPRMIIKGHSKPITALAIDPSRDTIFTGDMEGKIVRWKESSGQAEEFSHQGHKSQVQSMVCTLSTLISVGMDDMLASCQEDDSNSHWAVKLGSQPQAVAVREGDPKLIAVACLNEFLLYNSNNLSAKQTINYEASAIAIHPTENLLAVGSGDNKIRLYEFSDAGSMQLLKEESHLGAITSLRFSVDGKYIAVADATRRLIPYTAKTLEVVVVRAVKNDWTFHLAKINCLAWCPDSRHIATGSLDTNIIVWDMENAGEHPLIIKGAHKMSQITNIEWWNNNTLVSTGQDANLYFCNSMHNSQEKEEIVINDYFDS